MQTRVRLIALSAVVAVLALLAVPALASSPKGTYECKLAGFTIELKGHHKYTFSGGAGKAGNSGKWQKDGDTITFKTGPLDDTYGKLVKKGVMKVYDLATDQYFDKCVRK
jgi:hypothetical protein